MSRVDFDLCTIFITTKFTPNLVLFIFEGNNGVILTGKLMCVGALARSFLTIEEII